MRNDVFPRNSAVRGLDPFSPSLLLRCADSHSIICNEIKEPGEGFFLIMAEPLRQEPGGLQPRVYEFRCAIKPDMQKTVFCFFPSSASGLCNRGFLNFLRSSCVLR
jgi:hypothetical protein